MFFINIQGIPGFVGVVGSLGMSGELVRISPLPPTDPTSSFALTYSVADLPRVRESKTVLDSGFRYWTSDSL